MKNIRISFFTPLFFYTLFTHTTFFNPSYENWHVKRTWNKITLTPPNKSYNLSAKIIMLPNTKEILHVSTNNHYPASPNCFEEILKKSIPLETRQAALNQFNFWQNTVKEQTIS